MNLKLRKRSEGKECSANNDVFVFRRKLGMESLQSLSLPLSFFFYEMEIKTFQNQMEVNLFSSFYEMEIKTSKGIIL